MPPGWRRRARGGASWPMRGEGAPKLSTMRRSTWLRPDEMDDCSLSRPRYAREGRRDPGLAAEFKMSCRALEPSARHMSTPARASVTDSSRTS